MNISLKFQTIITVLAIAAGAMAQERGTPRSRIRPPRNPNSAVSGQDQHQGPGRFVPGRNRPRRAIVNAPLIKADEVKNEVNDNELVLGVVVDGQPRAYPINMLTGPSREIINDTLGGRAIAATW